MTAYWSPLFSWCMLPLIAAGVDDLLAGRLVLVAAGVLYLVAITKVMQRFASGQTNRDRVLTVGVSTIAAIQASVWATYFLDPDLIADALLFLYFARALDPELVRRPRRAILCGAIGGLAYLAKAYMLPFVIVHFPATLVLRRLFRSEPRAGTKADLCAYVVVCALFFAGLSLVAGPWVGLLSKHEGRPTFSTAGSSNHANMSPTNAGHDPLWNPGLVADFIADPRLTPDWSPLQDGEHFRHQIKLIVHNAGNCLGAAIFWFSLTAGAAAFATWRQRRAGRRLPSSADRFAAWWSLMTVAVYCGGYCLVNLECGISCRSSHRCCAARTPGDHGVDGGFRRESGRAGPRSAMVFERGNRALVLLFSVQDLHRMYDVAFHHLHGTPMTMLRPIARELETAGLSHELTAGNRDHEMLVIAYLCGNLQSFLGMPLIENRRADQGRAPAERSTRLRAIDRRHSPCVAVSRRCVCTCITLEARPFNIRCPHETLDGNCFHAGRIIRLPREVNHQVLPRVRFLLAMYGVT